MKGIFTLVWRLLVFSLISMGVLADDKPPLTSTIEVTGTARVIDGDTLAIGSQVIRISGIDAPEDGQSCERPTDGRWFCGREATAALRRLSADRIRCIGDEFDAYERLIASCTVSNEDIGRAMILEGLALAYRRYSARYIEDEDVARKANRGLWIGEFVAPWQWRQDRWRETGNAAPLTDCPIKGNISRDGTKIYHAPWSRSYSRTRIDEAKGERWFCNEAEALAAGWRAPFR